MLGIAVDYGLPPQPRLPFIENLHKDASQKIVTAKPFEAGQHGECRLEAVMHLVQCLVVNLENERHSATFDLDDELLLRGGWFVLDLEDEVREALRGRGRRHGESDGGCQSH